MYDRQCVPVCVCVRVTHNDACILFIFNKSVVKPYKLLMFPHTSELCLLEDLECGLQASGTHHTHCPAIYWAHATTDLGLYCELDFLLLTQCITDIHQQRCVCLKIHRVGPGLSLGILSQVRGIGILTVL